MNRAMGLALGVLFSIAAAQAGDIGVYLGGGQRSGCNGFLGVPLYSAGLTISHFEWKRDLIRPELQFGVWSSKSISEVHGEKTQYDNFDSYKAWSWNFRVIYGRNDFTKRPLFKPYLQCGFGLGKHEIFKYKDRDYHGNIIKTYSKWESHWTYEILGRVLLPLSPKSQIYVEALYYMGTRLKGIYPFVPYYDFKLGYRFRAF